MSFDLCVFDAPATISTDEAQQLYHQASDENETSAPNEKINNFLQEITSYYPQISDYADQDIDNCPWSADFDVMQTAVSFCIAWSRVEDVVPLIIDAANRQNLVCYDPQSNNVCRDENAA